MRISRRLLIIAILMVICTMTIATQYAVTKLDYEYSIVHPSDASIRLIGSDNSTDNIRMLRIAGSNVTNVRLILNLGENYAVGSTHTYSASFGIVNEEQYPLNITHINVTSSNNTYLKIWLHGNRTANANDTTTDPSSVLMYNNGTIVNLSNTTAWILAVGDGNASGMCYNTTNRTNCTIPTPWDETAHVRHSTNNTLAVSNLSDFVWVQVSVELPSVVDYLGLHTGTIWIYFESEAG